MPTAWMVWQGKKWQDIFWPLVSAVNTASSEVTPPEDCKVRPWQERQPHVPAESKPNPGAQEPPSLTLTLRSGEVDPTELGTLACQS